MQTFLPYPDFVDSAKSLDNKRLGKQRVEALQILKGIYIPDYGWRHHPCVKMWKDYPHALQLYMNACIDEWIDRGFKNTMQKARVDSFTELPSWFGNELFHDTHKSNLLRKDINFYVQYNWVVPMDLPYYWCGFSKLDEANYEGERNYDN
tara:strand:+ start:9283 stop:9732 length:450 start_codon:yes stop_codon:yes gene_type:complete